jgi:hypothetical protein
MGGVLRLVGYYSFNSSADGSRKLLAGLGSPREAQDIVSYYYSCGILRWNAHITPVGRLLHVKALDLQKREALFLFRDIKH